MEHALDHPCLPFLLFLPLYFKSQAAPFLRAAEAIYDNSRNNDGNVASASRPTRIINQTEQREGSAIAVPIDIAHPQPAHIESSPLTRSWNIMLYTPPELATHPSPRQVEASWISYVEHCCKIWIVIASLVGAILLATPPILSMPGTNGDPLVRGLVYLFIFRLVAALVSAVILEYYFGKDSFRRSTSAMLWYQKIKQNRRSCLYMPWTILALPVIAFCWGFVFLALSLFLSVWRTGLSSGLSPMEDVNPLMIRFIISSMSVADLAWIAWLVYTLKNQNAQAQPLVQEI